MRERYSFSSRRTRKLGKIRKQRQKYPKLVQDIVETSDIILEILDARFISETRNKEIEELIKEKHRKIIYVLNKSDLVSKKKPKIPHSHAFTSCTKRTGIRKLRDLIKKQAKSIKKPIDKDKLGKITVGVIGYPNTGKSSLINLLVGRKVAKTGADAGFTKGIQKLKLSSDIQLLDSPGVIPESEYSSIEKQAIARHTKVGGRSYSQIKDPESVVSELMKEFPGVFEKFYKINTKANSETLIEELGKKKNLLKKGGKVNEDKVSRLILKDWQEGNIKI
ncbi:GTPase [Nanoarchaeota archaeon]